MSKLKVDITLREFRQRLQVAFDSKNRDMFIRTLAQQEDFINKELEMAKVDQQFSSVGEH
jgi:hypothetical protein